MVLLDPDKGGAPDSVIFTNKTSVVADVRVPDLGSHSNVRDNVSFGVQRATAASRLDSTPSCASVTMTSG
jgi:hypothetical protein